MISSIAFTVYPIVEMARSRTFYEDVLGLALSHNFRNEWVEYDLGGSTFAITTMNTDRVPGAKGALIAFETAELDALVNTLKKRSVSFVRDVFSTAVCRMAVIQDPDGNELAIHQRHR